MTDDNAAKSAGPRARVLHTAKKADRLPSLLLTSKQKKRRAREQKSSRACSVAVSERRSTRSTHGARSIASSS